MNQEMKMEEARKVGSVLRILLIQSWPGPDQLGENIWQKLLINVPSLKSTFKVPTNIINKIYNDVLSISDGI